MTTPPALRSPLFVRVWAGGIVSAVGTQMSNVAKAWVLYELTHSAFALGVEGLCFSLPIMILPLLTGPLGDRLDRAALLQVTMAGEAVLATALTVAAATGTLQPWALYVTAALEAARLAVDIPARTALTTTLVPAGALLSAQSLSSVVYSAAALIGPALAGLLLATGGAAWVFAINAVSCVAALLVFAPVRRAAPARGWEPPRPGDGLRFAARHGPVLRLLTVLFATSTLVIGIETLLPVLARTLWQGGSVSYGLLRMAPGIAAIAAGAVLSTRRASDDPGRAVTLSTALACAGLTAFTFAPGLVPAFLLLAAGSVALSTAQVHLHTRIQQLAPDAVRAAVGGFTTMTQSGFGGIAAAGMALVAGGAGARPTIVVVAGLTAVTGLLTWVRAGPAAPSGRTLTP